MWPPGPGLVPDSPKLAQQTHLDHSSSDDSTSSWLAYQPTRSPGPDHRLGHHDRLRHTSQGPEVPMAWATKLIENYRRDAGWPAGGPVRVAGSDQAGTVSPRACQAANMEADLKLNLPPAVTVSSMRDTCGWQWAPWIFEKRYFHPLELLITIVSFCVSAPGPRRRALRAGLQERVFSITVCRSWLVRSLQAAVTVPLACSPQPARPGQFRQLNLLVLALDICPSSWVSPAFVQFSFLGLARWLVRNIRVEQIMVKLP